MRNNAPLLRLPPSLRRSQIVIYSLIGLISLAGLADVTYLTTQTLSVETMVCDGSADWFKVLGSSFSHLGKIPLVLLGAYFSVFSLATLGIRLRQRPPVLAHYRLVDVRSHSLVALRSGIYPSRFLSLLFVLRRHGLPPRRFSSASPSP